MAYLVIPFGTPIAHFSLGKYDTLNWVEIVWSIGEETVIDKDFLKNKRYVATRKS